MLPALKASLDGLVQDAGFPAGEFTPAEMAVFEEVIGAFLAAGPDLLDEATPHLWAYYRSTADEFTREQRAAYGIPELPDSTDVWSQVAIHLPPDMSLGHPPLSPARSYMSFEGEVSWEPEHGLQLVLKEGVEVCKVGPYDGHATTAHAFGDASLLGVIFK